jgi:hypothetical protein
MRVCFEVNTDHDPDECGELLLLSMNRTHRWGYSTHETDSPHWVKVDSPISLPVLTLLKGWFAKLEGGSGVLHLHNNINQLQVYLFWDGDGTIVFDVGGNYLVNNDMKKSYGWEWNPSWINELPENYYEDEEEERYGGKN